LNVSTQIRSSTDNEFNVVNLRLALKIPLLRRGADVGGGVVT